MSDIQLVAIDLDGTLLDDEKGVPQAHVDALRHAHAAGVHIVLCTGRMLPNIEATIDRLDLDLVIVAYNGAKVVDTRARAREVLFHRPISCERSAPLVDIALDSGWLLNVYHEDRVMTHIGYRTHPRVEDYHARGDTRYDFAQLEELRTLDPTKLVFISDPEEIAQIERTAASALTGLSCVRSHPHFLEIMAPDIDKGTALRRLADHFELSMDQVMAIGDGGNDIEMLQAAGVGVAVANAEDRVKAVADVITERTNNEGAVAEVFRHYFGN
ncbi:MAG: Cof subfamily protein (haloacid dehalogenase superfamily) [Gammaproteobacteria bacterium]